jgi:hypothetical protein
LKSLLVLFLLLLHITYNIYHKNKLQIKCITIAIHIWHSKQ